MVDDAATSVTPHGSARPGFLARLAGAAADDPGAATAEAWVFRMLGVLLLSLALLCGAVLAFVSITVLGADLIVGILAGLVVAGMVLIVNAILVPNAAVPRTMIRSLLAALPGFVVAVAIGVLVAAGLTAYFYRSQLDEQLTATRVAVAQVPFVDIPGKQQAAAALQKQVQDFKPFNEKDYPEIVRLDEQIAPLGAQEYEAEICWRDGNCPQGVVVDNLVQSRRLEVLNSIRGRLVTLRDERQKAAKDARDSYDDKLAAAKTDLLHQELSLSSSQGELDAAVDNARRAAGTETAASRIAAILPVARVHNEVWVAFAVLLVLYVALQTLPLIIGLVRSRSEDQVRRRQEAVDDELKKLAEDLRIKRKTRYEKFEAEAQREREALMRGNDDLRVRRAELDKELKKWERMRDKVKAEVEGGE